MGSVGPGELLLIVLIALLLFGAGRIAEIGKGLGRGIRNFKEGLRDDAEPKPLEEEAQPVRIQKEAPALPGVGDQSHEASTALAARARQRS